MCRPHIPQRNSPVADHLTNIFLLPCVNIREHKSAYSIENHYHENKNEFWKFLKSMENVRNKELPSIDNFKKLYITETYHKIILKRKTIKMVWCSKQNKSTKKEEVVQSIKHLKSKTSPGYDRIINKMLKCTNALGITLLTKFLT